MLERKVNYEKLFTVISSIGALFVLAEIIMQLRGQSICFTEGCKVVSQHARFGDISILVIGFVLFLLLALLSVLCRYRATVLAAQLLNILLIVALAAEGFFTGYQVFAVKMTCLFCLVVFGFIVTLGMIRLLAGEKELIAGFVSFAVIFCLFYLVLPATTAIALPENQRLVLFYSKDCKYCAEVKAELERGKINVSHVEVGAYSGLLKSIGIDAVPTLVVNDPLQKVFLVGETVIKAYLLDCARNSSVSKKPSTKGKKGTGSPDTTSSNLISPPNLFTGPAVTQPGGICTENNICK
jgi:hypothetical protein